MNLRPILKEKSFFQKTPRMTSSTTIVHTVISSTSDLPIGDAQYLHTLYWGTLCRSTNVNFPVQVNGKHMGTHEALACAN